MRKAHLNAAEAYYLLSHANTTVAEVYSMWPATFKDGAKRKMAIDKYWNKYKRRVPPDDDEIEIDDDSVETDPDKGWGIVFPRTCADEVKEYFEVAFDKAESVLVLDGNKSIYFRLKAGKPQVEDKKRWILPFLVDGEPEFTTMPEERVNAILKVIPQSHPFRVQDER